MGAEQTTEERDRQSNIGSDIDRDSLRNALRDVVCSVLQDYRPFDPLGLTLPGLSFRSQEENDPLHGVLLDGIVSGLRWFLHNHAIASDMCRGLSHRAILCQLGMTEGWCAEANDLFRTRLFRRVQETVQEAVDRHRPLARTSEVEHALRLALRDYRQYFASPAPLLVDDVIALVDNKLKDRRASYDVFTSVCRSMRIPIEEGKLFVSQDLLTDIQPSTSLVHTISVNVTGAENMKVDIGRSDHTIIAERIDKLEYRPQYGVSEEEFKALVEQMTALTPQNRAELAKHVEVMQTAQTEAEKQSALKTIKSFLSSHGIPIAQSLTATCLFELARCIALS